MAVMIPERRSTEMHLNTAYRHMRLCTQVKGADSLIQPIKKAIDELKAASIKSEEAKTAKEAAYDLVCMQDAILDDEIRTFFDEVKMFDRKNPTGKVMKALFPEESFGKIVNAPLYAEPDEAEKILTRLQSLDEEHSLKKDQEGLQNAITNSRDGLGKYNHLITQWKMAEAEEEIAKANLRRQYEHNYLDAIKLFDKRFAQRLFPNLTRAAKFESEVAEN